MVKRRNKIKRFPKLYIALIAFVLVVFYALYYIESKAWSKFPGDVDELLYENGNIKARGNIIDGFPYGEWEFYYENGEISHKGSYNDNCREHGIWKYYDTSGVYLYKVKFEKGEVLDTIREVLFHDNFPNDTLNLNDYKIDSVRKIDSINYSNLAIIKMINKIDSTKFEYLAIKKNEKYLLMIQLASENANDCKSVSFKMIDDVMFEKSINHTDCYKESNKKGATKILKYIEHIRFKVVDSIIDTIKHYDKSNIIEENTFIGN